MSEKSETMTAETATRADMVAASDEGDKNH